MAEAAHHFDLPPVVVLLAGAVVAVGLGAIAVLVAAGRRLLDPMFRLLARFGAREETRFLAEGGFRGQGGPLAGAGGAIFSEP